MFWCLFAFNLFYCCAGTLYVLDCLMLWVGGFAMGVFLCLACFIGLNLRLL